MIQHSQSTSPRDTSMMQLSDTRSSATK